MPKTHGERLRNSLSLAALRQNEARREPTLLAVSRLNSSDT